MKRCVFKQLVMLLFLLSVLTGSGLAENSEVSRTTLAGLQGIRVVVEKLQLTCRNMRPCLT
jgi:hypothetical protein